MIHCLVSKRWNYQFMQLDKGTKKNEKNQGFIWFQSVIPAIWVHYSSKEITLRKSQEFRVWSKNSGLFNTRRRSVMLSCLAVVLIGIFIMRHLFTTTKPNRDDCSAEHMVIKIGTLIRWRKLQLLSHLKQATTI